MFHLIFALALLDMVHMDLDDDSRFVNYSWELWPEMICRFKVYNKNPKELVIFEIIMWQFFGQKDLKHEDWYKMKPIPPYSYSPEQEFKLANSSIPSVVQLWSTIVTYGEYDYYTRVQARCNYVPQDANGTTIIIIDIANQEFKVIPPVSEYCKALLHYSNQSYIWNQ